MKKLAIALSTMLILGILGAGVLAKNMNSQGYGKGKLGEQTDPAPGNNGNGKGWGKGGNPNKPVEEEESEIEETEENEEDEEDEETEVEETEENGKGGKPTPKHPADHNGLTRGNGRVKHLYLYEKDENWDPVLGGAWGKMDYRPSGKTFRYTFTGHGLEPGVEYCLIYYPDPWPGNALICLGTGTTNNGGQLHLADRLDIGSMPTEEDGNYNEAPTEENPHGAKIWLVLSSDVDCEGEPNQMIGWNPSEYLFEYDLITYEDTDADE
jgi:hypothetical protein